CCFDNVQNFHSNDLPAHFVGITKVLVDSLAILKKSAGLPRLTPSTTLVAPRSSTQSPQLIQVRSGLSLPMANSELMNALVVGCSSSSTVVPLTGFACGACSFNGKQTAPS